MVTLWIHGKTDSKTNSFVNFISFIECDRMKHVHYTDFSFSIQLLYAAMNLTTNEMFNYKRYSYLKNSRGKYYNPYSRGLVYNLAEFFLCVQPVEPDDLRVLDVS